MQHPLRGVYLPVHGILAGILVACVAAGFLATQLPGLPIDWAVAIDDLATVASAGLAAALAMLVAFRVSSSRARWAWRLLSLGFLSSAVAEAVWSYYDVIAQTDVPTPSLAGVSPLPD